MKRKGLTLIEIVLSIALISIILTSLAGIVVITYRNIGANGEAIKSINQAKGEMDIAILTKSYTGAFPYTDSTGNTVNNVVSTVEKVDVLGTEIETRFITSEILDYTGYGLDTSDSATTPRQYFMYYQVDEVINSATLPFIDTNKDGLCTDVDKVVTIDELENNFTYLGNGNLVFRESLIDLGAISTNIKIKDDVIFSDLSELTTTGAITVTATNVIANKTTITATNDIKFIASENVEIKGPAKITSGDKNVIFKGKNVKVRGSSSDNTIIQANEEVQFDITDATGMIWLGDTTVDSSNHYVQFLCKPYTEYAHNINKSNFAITAGSVGIIEYPGSDKEYFK